MSCWASKSIRSHWFLIGFGVYAGHQKAPKPLVLIRFGMHAMPGIRNDHNRDVFDSFFGSKMQETTIHMIGSAHIDPVWYWSRQAGMIEVLSTCRTALEMLQNYDEFIFSLGDVWVYEILEKYSCSKFGGSILYK